MFFFNFAPQSPDLIGTSPDTSPDVSVFPLSEGGKNVSIVISLAFHSDLGTRCA